MEKQILDENLKKSLRIILFLFEVEFGRKFSPKIKSINSQFYSNNKIYTAYFETEYEISVEDPDLTEITNVLKVMDEKHFKFFSKFELNQKGEFSKQTVNFNERDDTVGLFRDIKYDRNDWKITVTFANEYNLYFD
jgi:hypothetical protein